MESIHDGLTSTQVQKSADAGMPASEGGDASWEAIQLAVSNAQHGEEVSQSRLNNFLFAVSILLLAWATLFDKTESRGSRPAVLIGVALLSAFLCVIWLILGTRQQKFFEMNWDLVARQEARLPENSRVNWWVWRMQYRNAVRLQSGKLVRLNRAEAIINSRSVLVIAPAAFLLISLVLIWVSAT